MYIFQDAGEMWAMIWGVWRVVGRRAHVREGEDALGASAVQPAVVDVAAHLRRQVDGGDVPPAEDDVEVRSARDQPRVFNV